MFFHHMTLDISTVSERRRTQGAGVGFDAQMSVHVPVEIHFSTEPFSTDLAHKLKVPSVDVVNMFH